MFSPIIFLLLRKRIPSSVVVVSAAVMIVCRVLEPLFESTLRMLVSGLGVGCFLILFPALLLIGKTNEKNQRSITLGISLSLALTASILLRTLNYTIDLSTYSYGQLIGWILAAVGIFMLIGFSKRIASADSKSSDEEPKTTPQVMRKRRLTGISFGLTSILFFASFAFSSPGVISRWTECNYVLVVSGVALMTALFAIIMLYRPGIIGKMTPRIVLIWNLLFVVLLVVTVYINQIPFPDVIDSYPIIAPQTTIFHQIPLIMMIATYPIILFDFILLSEKLRVLETTPSSRAVGVAFTLGGGIFMLVLLFTLILTSVWGFVPLIGPMLRDLFWLIILIAGVVLIVAIVSVRDTISSIDTSRAVPRREAIVAGFVVIMFVGTLAGAMVFEAQPVAQGGNPTSLRLLTYNLQQGVSDAQNKNYDGQLEIIRDIDADIIGLQETSKIAGSSDVVRYFANKLNLYSYFGPKGVTGTTGVALLSKYPIENASTIFHFSENVDRKQTATIEAEINVGSRTFTVYVTHTYGRTETKMILQNDILEAASDKTNVIFMGDFNFGLYSEPYNLTTNVLDDSWWVKWPTGTNSFGVDQIGQVDHIFLSPGISVTDCEYIEDPQSDHPAYWVDIEW
jgi:endonuclease/exonuclease/phosphatase family metal-dependent hydrolase